MYSFSRTMPQIQEIIEDDPYRQNCFFTKMTDEAMREITKRYSTDEMARSGYLVVDITPEEMEAVDIIVATSLQAFDCSIKESPEISECRNAIAQLNALISENPNMHKLLQPSMQLHQQSLVELEKSQKLNARDNELTRFLLKSSVAEEYVIGKIMEAIAKVSELKERCEIRDLDQRLEYRKKLMGASIVKPSDYDNYKDMRFSLLQDSRDLASPISGFNLTICFTNFQNVGEQEMVNRVINSITRSGRKKLRTAIFTTGEDMFTYKIRDDGTFDGANIPYCISPEDDDYRQYSFARERRPLYKERPFTNTKFAGALNSLD